MSESDPAAKPNGSLMSAFASAITTSYALHWRTVPFEAAMRNPYETFDCAQFVRVQSVRSTKRALMRANVTPLTLSSRAESAMVTVPQPPIGDTRMFLDALPRPTSSSTALDLDEPPRPGSAPGRTRMCTPRSTSASVTDAIALPIAAQSQPTSSTLPNVESGLGVFAGQCDPSGPQAPVEALVGADVTGPGVGLGVLGEPSIWSMSHSSQSPGSNNAGAAAAAAAAARRLRREIRPIIGSSIRR